MSCLSNSLFNPIGPLSRYPAIKKTNEGKLSNVFCSCLASVKSAEEFGIEQEDEAGNEKCTEILAVLPWVVKILTWTANQYCKESCVIGVTL